MRKKVDYVKEIDSLTKFFFKLGSIKTETVEKCDLDEKVFVTYTSSNDEEFDSSDLKFQKE